MPERFVNASPELVQCCNDKLWAGAEVAGHGGGIYWGKGELTKKVIGFPPLGCLKSKNHFDVWQIPKDIWVCWQLAIVCVCCWRSRLLLCCKWGWRDLFPTSVDSCSCLGDGQPKRATFMSWGFCQLQCWFKENRSCNPNFKRLSIGATFSGISKKISSGGIGEGYRFSRLPSLHCLPQRTPTRAVPVLKCGSRCVSTQTHSWHRRKWQDSCGNGGMMLLDTYMYLLWLDEYTAKENRFFVVSSLLWSSLSWRLRPSKISLPILYLSFHPHKKSTKIET